MKKITLLIILLSFVMISCTGNYDKDDTPENLVKYFMYESINNKEYTFEKYVDTSYIKDMTKDFFIDKDLNKYTINEIPYTVTNCFFEVINSKGDRIYVETYLWDMDKSYALQFIYKDRINNNVENAFRMLVEACKTDDEELEKKVSGNIVLSGEEKSFLKNFNFDSYDVSYDNSRDITPMMFIFEDGMKDDFNGFLMGFQFLKQYDMFTLNSRLE